MTPTRRTVLGGLTAALALPWHARAKTDTVPVLMDHDGGMPDDYLALALLLTMPHVKLLGVAVTPADSHLDAALNGTRKILAFFGSDAPVASSAFRGVHPFPEAWRKMSGEMDRLLTGPSFAIDKTAKPLAEPASQLLVEKLRASAEPVTIVGTGPLSNIAAALDAAPEIESKIQELVWMGGAILVHGNVEEEASDGSAEWNAYWDPPAVGRVWKSKIPITLCPLDITNRVPVTKAFLAKLAKRGDFGELAAKAYTISMGQNSDLYFWDVLAASWLGKPDMFTTRNFDTAVDVDGKSAGRIRSVDTGRKVKVLQRVDPEDFHKYLLNQWKR